MKPSEVEVRQLTPTEARELTDEIKVTGAKLWQLVYEAHQRGAWRALGYSTWEEYVQTEFSRGSSYGQYMLQHGKFMHFLCSSLATMVALEERQTRGIRDQAESIVEDVRAAVAAGADPQHAVEAAITERRNLPSPSEAQQLADEHGLGVAASDGLYHNPPTEVKYKPEVFMPHYRSFKNIRTVRVVDYCENMPPPMRPESVRLAREARDWITDFLAEAESRSWE